MLYYISSLLQQYFGPLRLFQSYVILIIISLYAGYFLSVRLIPCFYKSLPKDRGKDFCVGGEASRGKPTGSGIVFISIFVFLAFLLIPMSNDQIIVLMLTWIIMLTGYLDDASDTPWSEYKKGLIDLIISAAAAFALYYLRDAVFWLPFFMNAIDIPPAAYIVIATIILWISINATNCSDGIDGLSGTLVLMALVTLGILLYFVLGHIEISKYLLVPHVPDGARWAVMLFALSGTLMGYLWHNAYPSAALMGDAGSRALGFFIGVCVMVCGNPFLLFMTSFVLLCNGGTGLVKVVLLRFFKIRTFKNVRFPLHDHLRKNQNWSPTQILIRFSILQILISLAAIGVIFKIR